jgi:hypothetical protein
MASTIRNSLTFFHLKVRFISRRPFFLLLYFLSRLIKPQMALTYDNQYVCDGTGAQIQRLLAIYSLSKSLNLNYFHTPIKDVSVHPLDPHQSISQYKEYLDRLNRFADFPSDLSSEKIRGFDVIGIHNLKLKNLFMLICIKPRRKKLIKLVDVYGVVDSTPSIYHLARKIIEPRIESKEFSSSESKTVVAVHYRSVPGDFSVYNGESQTRQIQIDRVSRVISCVIKDLALVEPRLVVYTDAPPKDMIVDVFPSQEKLWEGTPGYSNGKLHLHGRELFSAFSKISTDIEIIVGGDPLEAIVEMARANVLIASKSSLSYVSAILRINSQVYSPSEFWHPIPHAKRF